RPGAVPARVMRVDELPGRPVQMRDLPDDPLPQGGVLANLLELLVGERPGLEEHAVGDADLAQVMQEEAVLELRIGEEVGLDARGEEESELGHALGVSPGLVVAEL